MRGIGLLTSDPFKIIQNIIVYLTFICFEMLRMKPQERLWLETEGGKVDLNSGEMENNVKVL